MICFGAERSNLHIPIYDASGNIIGACYAKKEIVSANYHVLEQI